MSAVSTYHAWTPEIRSAVLSYKAALLSLLAERDHANPGSKEDNSGWSGVLVLLVLSYEGKAPDTPICMVKIGAWLRCVL